MRRYTSAFAVILAFVTATAPAMAASKNKGPLLTVQVQHISGSSKLHITGNGPVDTPVQVHVAGWISRDLPEIPLGEGDGYSQLMTDHSGSFSTTVSLATDNWVGSLIRVEASVPNKNLQAHADYRVESDSPALKSSADHIPGK